MVVRGDRERVGADLVRGVAVGGDAVGADDHGVDVPVREPRGRGALGHHGHRDARALELPGGQPRALQQRARLAREHLDLLARGGLRVDHAERGAPAAGGEAAGVAERHQPARARQLGAAVLADQPARLAVLREDRERLGLDGAAQRRPVGRAARGGEHAVDRPREVDRRRPRGAHRRGGLSQALRRRLRPELVGREHDAERAADPDRGRAADREPRDRLDDLLGRVRRSTSSSAGSRVWSMISTASPVQATAARRSSVMRPSRSPRRPPRRPRPRCRASRARAAAARRSR